MNLKRTIILLTFLFVSGMAQSSASADTLNSATIIKRSMSPSCLNWRIAGICVWLKCTIFGCFIVTTPKISHRLPDLVVSSYVETFNNPWQEVKNFSRLSSNLTGTQLSGGSLSGVGTGLQHTDSGFFYETDVIGNPAAHLLKFNKFLCKSSSRPLFPYYLSTLDAAAWRTGIPDAMRQESITPGAREIGNWPHSTWGPVYPRSGFVVQSDPAKAAAVTAQRAIDIVIRDGAGHIHKPFGTASNWTVTRGDTTAHSKNECEASGGNWSKSSAKDETYECKTQSWHQWHGDSNEKTDMWQMISPKHESSCETFGAEGDWSSGKISEDGNYVWNYWRPYKCCIKSGGALLRSVDF